MHDEVRVSELRLEEFVKIPKFSSALNSAHTVVSRTLCLRSNYDFHELDASSA